MSKRYWPHDDPSRRYWEADAPPEDALLDWVNENVVAALDHFWTEDKPVMLADIVDGQIVFAVVGPEKPIDESHSGPAGCYEAEFNPIEALRDSSYKLTATALRKLANEIAALAAEVEQSNEN